MSKCEKNLSVSFHTYGCRLNQAETAVIQNTLERDGYQVVDFNEPADMVVVNTCTVTENGDADTRRLVHKINRINPDAHIALVGCQAQIQKAKLGELPNVRWIVGNAKKFDLAAIFKEFAPTDRAHVIAPTIPRDSFTMPVAAVDRQHTRANLKIQDGCDFFCSFCEIPYARGRARSRKFDNILTEAQILVAAGHREVILTGINLGTYRGETEHFLDVIDALEEIEGLDRIRISSIEPTTIPFKIFEKMAAPGAKLCRHLHIPLQSGSDAILRLMKRKYTADEFSDFIIHVFTAVPEICIGTDVIVGFPGETDTRFEATLTLLRDLPISYFHVFRYSERTLAKSRNLPEAVPRDVIQARSRILRELSTRKRRICHESLIGTTQAVLFEQKKSGLWNGLTDNYIRVHVASEQELQGRLAEVRLVKIERQNVFGEIQTQQHQEGGGK